MQPKSNLIRVPFADLWLECQCGAVAQGDAQKDDCLCIRPESHLLPRALPLSEVRRRAE